MSHETAEAIELPIKLPPELADHEWIAERVFYTLPKRLLEALIDKIGEESFNPERLRVERILSDAVAHNPHVAGFQNGQSIDFALLSVEPEPLVCPTELQRQQLHWSKTVEHCESTARILRARLQLFLDAERGYAGWLMTEPKFLAERDAFLAQWDSHIERLGLPRNGPTVLQMSRVEMPFAKVTDGGEKQYLDAYAAFCARWRLADLRTAELPEPLTPQIPVQTPLALLTHMQAGGVTLYQPDTMPVPSRDKLRTILEEVRESHENEHLAEWIQIVGRDRHNDHSIQLFGSIFVVRHFEAVLNERHAEALDRKIGRMEEAFADFLAVSADAVDKYRQRIRRRRPSGSPAAP